MDRGFPLLTLFSAILVWCICAAPVRARQAASTFEVSGEVVDLATGKPVAGALVDLFANVRLAQFSDSNGAFVFTGVPSGRFPLIARKPGFFDVSKLGPWRSGYGSAAITVPSVGNIVVKLMPEGILYGQVKDENGEPLQRVNVRLERWQILFGHKELMPAGFARTDDQGNFRIWGLRPATYFLWFRPANWMHLEPPKADEKDYGSEFYSGVPDLASATPIKIRYGSQVGIEQTLRKQRTFEISGTLAGIRSAIGGVNFNVIGGAGDFVQKRVYYDRTTGHFRIFGIPAGTYLLSAAAHVPAAGGSRRQSQLRAWQRISITSDLSGVVLTLGPPISIPIRVEDESSQNTSGDIPQAYVRLISRLFPSFSRAMAAPRIEHGQKVPAVIDGLFPGTYYVLASANGPDYVAALRCGNEDLLQHSLTVGTSGSLPAIVVTLRDDGARLTGTVTENGLPAAAGGVVIYSDDEPNLSRLSAMNAQGEFTAVNLAPGEYEVFAVRDPQDFEFRSPKAIENYLGRATEVTLSPYGRSTVRLELPHASEGQP